MSDDGTNHIGNTINSNENSIDDNYNQSDDIIYNDPLINENIVSMFYTYDELEKWFLDKNYEKDCYLTEQTVGSESLKFENLVKYGNKIFSGSLKLYYPYINGEKLDNISLLRVITYYSEEFPEIHFHIQTSEQSEKVNISYMHVKDEYKNSQIKDNKDVFIPDLDQAYKDIVYEFTEIKLSFMGDSLSAYRTYFPCFPVGNIPQFYYQFIYNDMLVSITLYENDSIQDFLDGFELRPIDLSDEKIPTE